MTDFDDFEKTKIEIFLQKPIEIPLMYVNVLG